MRIAMVTTGSIFSDNISGGQRRFRELYNALCRTDNDITLYCGDKKKNVPQKISNIILFSGSERKNKYIPQSAVDFVNNFSVYLQIKRRKYDKLIVFDVFQMIWFVLLLVENTNLLLRQDIIEYKSIQYKKEKKPKILNWIMLRLLSLSELLCVMWAKKIIVQCQYDLDKILSRHSFFREKIKIKTCVQINNVNPTWIVDKSKSFSNNKCRNDIFTICYIGNFNDNRKGHHLLLPAICNIIDQGKILKLWCIGSGTELEMYKKKYMMYGNVIFMGFQANPIQYIIKSDLVIVPSIADSCPNTVMEALYNNIPVIGANAGGIGEILNEKEWVFEPRVEEIQEKIIEVLNGEIAYSFKRQKKRKEELTFDWGKYIVDILER